MAIFWPLQVSKAGHQKWFRNLIVYLHIISPLQTGTSQKTAMVEQPEPVVAPCEAPERQEEKEEEKKDEIKREKVEMKTEENKWRKAIVSFTVNLSNLVQTNP